MIDVDISSLEKLSTEQLIPIARAAYVLLEKENSISSRYQKRYYNDPVAWVDDFVSITLKPYQRDILIMIRDGNNKIAVKGPHGLGKSVIASLIILWAGSVSADCKIPTTASAWRQLEEYLWPEVHKWYSRVNWEKVQEAGGRGLPTLLNLECKFSEQSKAFAVASDDPSTIEGAHAKRIVYIFDESKTIPAKVWEAADGAFATPGDHIEVTFSTPGDTTGVYYSICSRQKGYEGWKVRHVSLREAIRAGQMSLAWAREKRDAWGASNPVYLNRVWGLFAKDSDESIIPLTWVEAAVRRWHAWKDGGSRMNGSPVIIGADTAGQGVDKCKFYYRKENIIFQIDEYGKSRPMELAGKLANAMGKHGELNIDVSYGEGAGTADRIKELEGYDARVHPVNFGCKTDRTDKSGLLGFANVRAAMWWNMREMLDPDSGNDIALPDEPLLIGDLVTPRKKTRSDGKILIESKEDIKKRIGRSTDDGDACCLAFWKAEDEKIVPDFYVR